MYNEKGPSPIQYTIGDHRNYEKCATGALLPFVSSPLPGGDLDGLEVRGTAGCHEARAVAEQLRRRRRFVVVPERLHLGRTRSVALFL